MESGEWSMVNGEWKEAVFYHSPLSIHRFFSIPRGV
jgi:hypothetical protein